MSRKFESLDPMKLYSTLKIKSWKTLLNAAMDRQDSNTLMKWRYGLQAGLADANAHGKITTEKIDCWVIARIKDVENAMKYIVKERNPNPMDDIANAKIDTKKLATAAKRKRDREFQLFLMQSNF